MYLITEDTKIMITQLNNDTIGILPAKDTTNNEKNPSAQPNDEFKPLTLEEQRDIRIRTTFSAIIQKAAETVKDITCVYIGSMIGMTASTAITANPIILALATAGGGYLAYHLDKTKLEKTNITEKVKLSLASISESIKGTAENFLQIPWRPKENKKEANSVFDVISDKTKIPTKITKSFPNILYPSIKAANAAHKETLMKILDGLPLKDVTSVNEIALVEKFSEGEGILGLAMPRLTRNVIHLRDDLFSSFEAARNVATHENGHTKDFNRFLNPIFTDSSLKPWGKPPYPIDPLYDTPTNIYGMTNHYEDYAQAHMFYHCYPEILKTVAPDKFAAMEKSEKLNFLEKVLDRPVVREWGKKISQTMDKVPFLRNAFDLLKAIAGPLSLHKSAEEIRQGVSKDDKGQLFHGELHLASALAYCSGPASFLGLIFDIAHWGINKAINKGTITIEKARVYSRAILANIAGPIGHVIGEGTHALLLPDAEIQQKTNLKENLQKLNENAPTLSDTETDLIAAASAAAGAVGATASYIINYASNNLAARIVSAISGGFWGGAIVGSLTLAGFYLNKYKKEMATNKELQNVLANKDDMLYMLKVYGGSAILGLTGGVLGKYGGSIIGGAAGAMAAGPLGGLLGAGLGGFAGSLIAANQGAKLGAALGKKFDDISKTTNISQPQGI